MNFPVGDMFSGGGHPFFKRNIFRAQESDRSRLLQYILIHPSLITSGYPWKLLKNAHIGKN
jgi:hypothetical protein